jgi:hypothetical protein
MLTTFILPLRHKKEGRETGQMFEEWYESGGDRQEATGNSPFDF